MSVEVWDHDELLGLASERIVEYIDNLETHIAELEAANARTRMPGCLWARIVRLHRWLRKARAGRESMYNVAATAFAGLQRRAAMADELATALRQRLLWNDPLEEILNRFDATRELAGPCGAIRPTAAESKDEEAPNGQ